jgi:hypothetical protein
MKDERNLHQRVQEMIDCYATGDPLKEMSEIGQEADLEEAAVKWLALAALHGVNSGAKKIELEVMSDGSVEVEAKYRESHLPAPSAELAKKVLEVMRGITHLEGEKGKEPLALGVRNDSLNLFVKLKDEGGKSELKLKFPE